MVAAAAAAAAVAVTVAVAVAGEQAGAATAHSWGAGVAGGGLLRLQYRLVRPADCATVINLKTAINDELGEPAGLRPHTVRVK